MPEDQSGGEKTEDPTPKKLRDARNEGQVAFSAEANTAVLLLVGFSALILIGPGLYRAFAASLRTGLAVGPGMAGDLRTAADTFVATFALPGLWALGLMGVFFLIGLAVSLLQVGLGVTLKPLVPKFQRISPLSGLKRIFGLRGLMRFVFSLTKLTLIVSVAWFVLQHDVVHGLVWKTDLAERFADKAWLLVFLALKLAGVLGIIAAFDILYQRYQHHKDLLMTKQEVKEEFKQSEGDPLVKSKIRQIQRQMAQNRMMQEVPKADVVITNPTHVAVALQYDQMTMVAPVVVAKGYDLIALQIKRIASEHDIIMVENVTLARALAKQVEVGGPIPVDLYQAVAEVLALVYKMRGQPIGGAA